MAIEGPLHELGLPDVFQLLDFGRKTGVLRVTSEDPADEAVICFHQGHIVQALVRTKPPIPYDRSELTPREIARRLRNEIEYVVFRTMEWREGYFTFEERPVPIEPEFAGGGVPTESLLMESARRIDEWSRITDKIPNLDAIPALGSSQGDDESQLHLLPHEWEVLALVDGRADLRGIARALGRQEFDAAKVIYGLVSTGVVEIVNLPNRAGATVQRENPEVAHHLRRGFDAARAGDLRTATVSWRRLIELAPEHPRAAEVRAALEAAETLSRVLQPPPEAVANG